MKVNLLLWPVSCCCALLHSLSGYSPHGLTSEFVAQAFSAVSVTLLFCVMLKDVFLGPSTMSELVAPTSSAVTLMFCVTGYSARTECAV